MGDYAEPVPAGPITSLSFDSVPVLSVLECSNRGTDSLNGLLEIFEGRMNLDKNSYNFCQTVSTRNLHDLEIKKSTSERTMGILKNYFLFMAGEQLKYQRQLKEGVIGKLSELKNSRHNTVSRSKNMIENASRDVKQAGELLTKSKQNFVKAKLEMVTQREKLIILEAAVEAAAAERLALEGRSKEEQEKGNKKSFSRMLSAAFETTPESERDKQEKRVSRRAHDLVLASADIKTRKAILTEKMSVRDFSIQQATLQLQEAETQRLLTMKSVVGEFCALERAALNEQSRLLKMLEDTVAEQQPVNDINAFINDEKRPESTLKYTKALALLDWNYHRRSNELPSFVQEEASLSAAVATLDEEERGYDLKGSKATELLSGHALSAGQSEQGGQGNQGDVWKDSAEFDSIDVDDDAVLLTLQALGEREVEGVSAGSPLSDADANAAVPSSSPTALPEMPPPVSSPRATSPLPADAAQTAEREKTLAAVRAIFEYSNIPSHGQVSDAMTFTESEWGVMMENKAARDLFLQELDERRGDGQLSRRGFDTMAMAMTAILNACLQNDEVKSAMRIANMANTFYCILEADEQEQVSDADSDDSLGAVEIADDSESNNANNADEAKAAVTGEADETASNSPDKPTSPSAPTTTTQSPSNALENPPPCSTSSAVSPRRRYLQREPSIKHHKWWASEGFWEKALLEGVGKELSLIPAVRWDDLPSESLREAVIGVHNIVFGQLGALAFTMHELGMAYSEAERTILEMSRGAQLSEEHERMLMRSLLDTFGLPSS